jgi:uncharacterized protein
MPRLVGMVHLGPLPGSPRHSGDLAATVDRAVADARALADCGFDALLVENFGDAPFYADAVPPVTVAAMTRAVTSLIAATPLPVGVNVLRNDAMAAMSIAAATGASFIRVNVLSGTMFTDQGPIVGRAAEVSRLRAALGAEVLILADVFVKHAVPPEGWTIERAAVDLWERGGADALIVSGSGTGEPIDDGRLATVAAAVPDAPLYAGSGVDERNVASILETCRGVIVGTSIKRDGLTTAPVDPDRARSLATAAG